jgi:hypothetical protein
VEPVVSRVEMGSECPGTGLAPVETDFEAAETDFARAEIADEKVEKGFEVAGTDLDSVEMGSPGMDLPRVAAAVELSVSASDPLKS